MAELLDVFSKLNQYGQPVYGDCQLALGDGTKSVIIKGGRAKVPREIAEILASNPNLEIPALGTAPVPAADGDDPRDEVIARLTAQVEQLSAQLATATGTQNGGDSTVTSEVAATEAPEVPTEAPEAGQAGEPWPGYADQKVTDIRDALADSGLEVIERVIAYEEANKARKQVLAPARARRELLVGQLQAVAETD